MKSFIYVFTYEEYEALLAQGYTFLKKGLVNQTVETNYYVFANQNNLKFNLSDTPTCILTDSITL